MSVWHLKLEHPFGYPDSNILIFEFNENKIRNSAMEFL